MTEEGTMRLRVLTPASVVVDAVVTKVTAEAANGSFTLLPRHVDLVASLVPGLLAYIADDEERLLAVDTGTLVKCGREVEIATTGAFPGDRVLTLQRELRDAFVDLTDRERRSRAALARLESDVTARLIELEANG